METIKLFLRITVAFIAAFSLMVVQAKLDERDSEANVDCHARRCI